MKTTFIYALCEPGTLAIRYLGKSDNPKRRLNAHVTQSITYKSYLGNWLAGLKSHGETPVMEILDEVPETQWKFWEKEYIRVFKSLGFRLVNLSDGGDGFGGGEANPMFGKTGNKSPNFGKPCSASTRLKISEKNRGKTSWNKGGQWSEAEHISHGSGIARGPTGKRGKPGWNKGVSWTPARRAASDLRHGIK